MKNRFEVVSPFQPQGDQPQAIDKLTANLSAGQPFQTLLGATGTGKTFTMAHTIARLNRPTLVISHNKTLAAQLYEDFKDLFPNNSVGYFVSYYDYNQPEVYITQRDIYIEKDDSRDDVLYRVRGDVVEVHPSYEEFAYRIEFFGDEITTIHAINPLTGELLKDEDSIFIYPAVHYVMPENQVQTAVANIREELEQQVMHLRGQGNLLEAQ